MYKLIPGPVYAPIFIKCSGETYRYIFTAVRDSRPANTSVDVYIALNQDNRTTRLLVYSVREYYYLSCLPDMTDGIDNGRVWLWFNVIGMGYYPGAEQVRDWWTMAARISLITLDPNLKLLGKRGNATLLESYKRL